MTNQGTSRWYVACTQSRMETRAAQHLRQQDFSVYLPRYEKTRRHARKTETVNAPLFPRYLFVHMDIAQQRWRSIQGTVGISHLICNGSEPVPITASVIQLIQAREDQRGLVSIDWSSRFEPGDRVRILDDTFAGCQGLFEGTSDKARVSILMELLGRKVRVLIDAQRLEAA